MVARSDAEELTAADEKGPLDGIRVLEVGVLVAGPFCGQLLGDLGAEVIKIEDPGKGDVMRNWSSVIAKGKSLWWPIVARNKKSLELNLRDPRGQQIFKDLVRVSDIVLENTRPGTFEGWGLGYDELNAINPGLIMVRVSGYGQTGPYAPRAGYASVGEAMAGLRYVTGYPDRPPSRVGISIGDSLAGIFGALGALAALHERTRSGKGQVIDCSIYESVLACMESIIPDYVLGNHIRQRTGPIVPNAAPSNVYPTKDGQGLIIAANQATLFRRLCGVMGRPELAEDPRFATDRDRGTNMAELDALIAEWSSTFDSAQLNELLQANGIAAGRIYTVQEMLEDPQYTARESIVRVASGTFGDFPMQNVFPKLSRTPGRVRWAGPEELGEHNDQILGDLLGLGSDEVSELLAEWREGPG